MQEFRGSRERGSAALLLLAFFLSTGCRGESETTARKTARVIYDADDREELESSAYAGLGSVALALIPGSGLDALRAGQVAPQGEPWCAGERFADQPRAAVCSAVALTERYVLTAAHCVPNQDDCKALAVVRNYAMPAAGDFSTDALEAFGCDSVVASRRSELVEADAFDFAIVRLERPLPDFNAATLDIADALSDEVQISISASAGLPLKVSSGRVAAVDKQHGYFRLALDVAAGSSGGGVFNERGQLTGIVVSGAQDYVDGPKGCLSERVVDTDQQGAAELANSASAIVRQVCTADQSLPFCRPATSPGDGLHAVGGGCGVVSGPQRTPASTLLGMTMMLLASLRLRRRCDRIFAPRTTRLAGVSIPTVAGVLSNSDKDRGSEGEYCTNNDLAE